MIYKSMALFFIGFIFLCTACKDAPSDNVSSLASTSALFHIPFFSSDTLNNPVLVLVLHGDAPFNNPSYQYGIAKRIAGENDNVVAVGVLRPGYTDNEGNKSKGERGEATGDNYTKEVLESIHQLSSELKDKYQPTKVILVGHSGGAAISANLLAQYPKFYVGAVLISCPCDLHQWRKHMKNLRPEASIWDVEVASLSPLEELIKIDTAAKITVIHGEKDEVVPINIANEFIVALEANKKQTNFVLLEEQGHEVAFNKRVFESIKALLKN